MHSYKRTVSEDGRTRVEVPFRGTELLAVPIYNKGTAFTTEERATFGLDGLLPETVSTMDLQALRIYESIVRKPEPLEQYIGLAGLQDRNEYLYYRVLLDHLEEFLPVVYTPTVGQASKEYSHIFRRGRGIWITPAHRGRIAEVLRHSAFADIRLIVATDNQAILGIGDQGAGGMVIPIGKLAIYSAAAGIHPAETLPLSLDVGTDNRRLLDDPLYLGWRQPRLQGDEYFDLVAEFVAAVQEVFPRALLQWEDFQKNNAFELLERYRERIVSFNDDIQGTGATALAGLMAACLIAEVELSRQRIVIVGGGAAGIGIARQLRSVLAAEGLSGSDLHRAVAVLDSKGLIVDDRERIDQPKREVAWPTELAAAEGLGSSRDLHAVVYALKPSVLIGTSGQTGIFSEELVQEMAKHTDRPIIFPFSNPNDLSEARPQDLLWWTEGRALVATGSPFPPVDFNGRELTISQGNNALIFPGVGLGTLVAGASEISDGMFTAAARALAANVTQEERSAGRLFPAISRLREVTRDIAAAVVRQARDEGLARDIPDDQIDDSVKRAMWTPEYPEYVPV
ncbi:MAG: NAD-dependent malic enzyme [Thermoanaerobaculia bacterium]